MQAIVLVSIVSHYVFVLVRIVVGKSIIVVGSCSMDAIGGIVVAIVVRIGNVVVIRRNIVEVTVHALRITFRGYLSVP